MTNTYVKTLVDEIKSNYPTLTSSRIKMIEKYLNKAYEAGYNYGTINAQITSNITETI